MRSNPCDYELTAPGSLPAVLSLLASQPGSWLPLAGGTDLMVLYGAGTLPQRRLVSIWSLPELRRVEVTSDEVRIGAGCTYTDIQNHDVIQDEFPLLTTAARWTGGIANQNRGTLGGNIVNASPAADSLPALLAYEADLILTSIRGERRLPYATFHTSYKKTRLAVDELVLSVCLPRQYSQYFNHARKVGARNAQAISKVCIAALGLLEGTAEPHESGCRITDVRIALGSVAPVPLRLTETERVVTGRLFNSDLLAKAKKTAMSEIQPIDDIRSTARYRSAVAGNLVVDFLKQLKFQRTGGSNPVLMRWNQLSYDDAVRVILPCCGSTAWAQGMARSRPLPTEDALLVASDQVFRKLEAADWMEAFRSHPRIGESQTDPAASARSAAWSEQEQHTAANSAEAVKHALAEANHEYEQRFGHIFLVCATGRTAAEILEVLQLRLHNDAATELQEAAEQQRQITAVRLRKWLQG